MKVPFAIRPWENVGFTDQLLQFSAFYKIGRSLGWIYHHLDFTNHRSSPTIYEYLGFNKYMRNFAAGAVVDPSDQPHIQLSLCDRELDEKGVRSFEDLQNYLKRKAETLFKENVSDPEGLVCLSLAIGSTRRFFSLVEAEIRDLPDQVDLRAALSGYGRYREGTSEFIDRPLKVLIHMRLGDTAFLRTPWDTFIYKGFEKGMRGRLVQTETLDDLSFIEPGDYLRVAKRLHSMFPENYVSTLFCSDGYGRLFDLARNQQKQIGLSPEQAKDLRQLRKTYDRSQFEEFQNIRGSRLLIGETDESLISLIEAVLSADLIIMGRVQRMIPKFFVLFPNLENPQKVIVVAKDDNHPTYAGLGLGDGRKAMIAAISIGNSDFDEQLHWAINHLFPEMANETPGSGPQAE